MGIANFNKRLVVDCSDEGRMASPEVIFERIKSVVDTYII